MKIKLSELRRTASQLFVDGLQSARRHRPTLALLTIPVVLAVTGCGRVTFHDPAQPNKDIGFEYYKPKLYLLVTQTQEGAKAEVLTLPDLTQPRYAILESGYGSSNLSVKVSNGMLTEVGQVTDSQLPETITALGTLATAAGTLTNKGPRDVHTATAPSPFKLYEVINLQGQLKLKEVTIE